MTARINGQDGRYLEVYGNCHGTRFVVHSQAETVGVTLPRGNGVRVAATVLEGEGCRPTGPVVEPEHSQPSDADWYLRAAASHLAAAAAIREYHAKPRVTDEQVAAVASRMPFPDRPATYGVQAVLQAALDSGVLVPADNKEDDR